MEPVDVATGRQHQQRVDDRAWSEGYPKVRTDITITENSVLNMKVLVGAFNQEKALVGAFSVITNLRVDPGLKL